LKIQASEDEKQKRRKTFELIANLIALREELDPSETQLSTMKVNKLAVLPVERWPSQTPVIMGHLPIYGLTKENIAEKLGEDTGVSDTIMLQKLKKFIGEKPARKSA
jgi:antitoxin component HigA of HigAB toxin-antitoxin module